MKFEIAKRKYTLIRIYLFITLIICLLVFIITNRIIAQNKTFGNTEAFLSGIIAILFYIILKVVPSLRLLKHSKTGYIHFSANSISIEAGSRNEEMILSEIDHIEMRLNGYNGQPQVGEVASYFTDIHPVDGLGNTIRLSYKNKMVQFEFYIESNKDYEKLKQIIKIWPTLTQTTVNVLR